MTDDVTRRAFLGTTAGLVLVSRAGSAGTAAAFTRVDRRALAAAMDAIVPGDGRMPAASAVKGVAYVEQVAASDDEVGARLGTVLRTLGPQFAEMTPVRRRDALRELERADSAAFATLRDLVYEAYYTSPDVLRRLGHPVPIGAARGASLDPSFDERQLDRVRALPPLFRDVP